MKAKASNQNRFVRIITIPIRVLGKARDYYVKSLTGYADRVTFGNVMGVPGAGPVHSLPKSFSVNSARSYENEHIGELLRAASARSNDGRVDLDSYLQHQMKMRPSTGMGSRAMPRSSTVVMGRIDEDNPCNYFGENNVNISRSRSHAVPRRTTL